DLRRFNAKEEVVTLSTSVFPLKDFQPNKVGDLDFLPQNGTRALVTPLHLAAYYGKDDVVKLLSPFFDEHSENTMATPLFLALANSHRNTALLLLKYCVISYDDSCANGLHAAARQGDLDMIEHFVQSRDFAPDTEDMDGATPAVYALYLPEKQAIATISLLFDLGAKADARFGDSHHWTYADLARAMGNEGLASWLK
ncbi:ankyrin repeat-containing domain protein, partial [Dactylonectria macrodidyma]